MKLVKPSNKWIEVLSSLNLGASENMKHLVCAQIRNVSEKTQCGGPRVFFFSLLFLCGIKIVAATVTCESHLVSLHG